MMNGWAMGWMWVWPVLVLAGLMAIAAAAVLWSRGSGSEPVDGAAGARRILDERFARGEIDEEEYRRRCAELP